MVHTRFVRNRSPNLQQEILADDASIGALGVGLTNLILDIAKEVGDVILRLIILDYWGRPTATGNTGICQCAVISKPKSEGVPVTNDFSDPRYTVADYM